jgi:hypothetical protein
MQALASIEEELDAVARKQRSIYSPHLTLVNLIECGFWRAVCVERRTHGSGRGMDETYPVQAGQGALSLLHLNVEAGVLFDTSDSSNARLKRLGGEDVCRKIG